MILGWLPVVAFKPHIGVLVWSWVSHMAPQAYTYNFALTFPFLVVVAAATLGGMVLNRDKKSLPSHPLVVLIFVYWLWVIITTIMGFDPGLSQGKLVHLSKVLFFALISMVVMQSPNRLKAYLWVMVASLMFIAVKGGLFTILTGGGSRVQGAGGMMGDNNQLAMAMCMLIPLAIYLAQHPPHQKLKWPLIGAAILVPVSVMGTQSRGGFAALAAVVFMLFLKAQRKFAILVAVLVIGGAAVTFMPDSWKERMQSTEDATEDNSFLGRVSMWKFSVNLADENPLQGGGFNIFYVPRAAELYMPPGHDARAPHSIYFEVLAEHGYTGLVLFLSLLFTGWYCGGSQAKKFRKYEETKWLGDLCWATQLSIVGFAAGGLTVNIATLDIFYHILAVIVLCNVVGDQLLAGEL
ncbi:MAG: putative O-glycosylation ligase, exosortase A system-associated, partial [Kordiimonas sp.]